MTWTELKYQHIVIYLLIVCAVQWSEALRTLEYDFNGAMSTPSTSSKGALAEAELAKARVEGRRRQEQETKQQQRQPPVPVPSVNAHLAEHSNGKQNYMYINNIELRTVKKKTPPLLLQHLLRHHQHRLLFRMFCADCVGFLFVPTKIEHERSQCPKRMVECVSCKCRHCAADVPSLDLLEHEINCDKVLKQCPHCLRQKVECKFCDDEIDANKIDAHELKVGLLFQMPQSALTTHASRCSKRPIKCIRCCQLFPADAIVAHSTNCKVEQGGNSAASSQTPAVRAPIKIPPPPPFPPPPTATTPTPTSQQNTRRATADPRVGVTASIDTVKAPATPAEESESDRLARRNLALSQLTNPGATPTERNTGSRASAPRFELSFTNYPTDVEDDEDEEDEEEDDDEDDDDQLTLAQVVKEWNVENVCLWLHEDVGVPDVVLRFQQKQCNGEMLLELTESDLINDFGVKDRVQRERILSAIEAINTSNAFSEEDDERMMKKRGTKMISRKVKSSIRHT
ncbi:Sterile alpha motif/pointed domain [Phytophthora cactorum]|nr:Sterile alpha motif/pointed domain [Phytophthora cactorum]